MEAKYPEIMLSEQVCSKIKDIYFTGKAWPDCSKEVAAKFTVFCRIMRKYYPDKDIVDILKSVQKFDTLDIQEVIDTPLDDDAEKQPAKMKYGNDVVWVPVPIDKPELLEQVRKMLR